jgi:hypothetical protein
MYFRASGCGTGPPLFLLLTVHQVPRKNSDYQNEYKERHLHCRRQALPTDIITLSAIYAPRDDGHKPLFGCHGFFHV